MAETTHDVKKASAHWAWLYSSGLLLIGDLLLWVLLWNVRSERIAGTQVAFFTPEFMALAGLAAALIGLTLWGMVQQRLAQFITKRSVLWVLGWFVLSVGVLVVAPNIAPFLRNYWIPFAVWLVCFNLALAVLAVAPQLSQLDITRFVRFAATLMVMLLIPFAVLEIGLRLYFSAFGTEDERVTYLYPVDDILTRLTRVAGSPYINFGLNPNHPDHNARGYRSRELSTPKPAGEFRIFAVGGSTTYGVGLAPDDAYPAQLERILHEQYGYTHVRVVNAGVMLYATPDNLANFTFKILDDAPDMLLTYEGVNDVVTRLVDPARYNGLNEARGIWSPQVIDVSPSVLIRFLQIKLGVGRNPALLESALLNVSDVPMCRDIEFCANLNLTPQQVLEANPPLYFERNLRNLVALAQANDVAITFSTWAYFPEPSNGSLYMTYPHMQFGVAQHNTITRQLAAEFNIPLIDLAETMPYNAAFWQDGLHMTTVGAREQAQQYAAFLVENGLIPEK